MKNSLRISGVIILILFTYACEKEVDDTIKDIDGNIYTSVTIGSQVWMVENLKTAKYRNGDLIGTTNPATLNITGESTPKYQWIYDGAESNLSTYGRLYTWYAIADSRSVCPTGWHVPTDEEWTTLITNLGGESVAGGKLKETGTTHWLSPNAEANNETGFTALPGGYRFYSGTYSYIGSTGSWWSSTEQSATNAYNRSIGSATASVYRAYNGKGSGFSVRCLRD